jgi:protein-S-isoprenylcysteine O-methyltransferase Ste14
MARTLSLILRNLVFTVVVPGLGGALVPWWILTRHGRTATPAAWAAVPVIAAGPYRWVRNPIYLAALLIVLGEAWLFLSLALLAYAGAMAVVFHLFVIGYEEPTLRRRFGSAYLEYQRMVPRWIPRRPRHG